MSQPPTYGKGKTDGEDFITNMGHDLTNCEWMEHSNPIVITK
jgi:hypothetical protein